MIRYFEVEWEDELGPMWMNVDNLILCINAYCEGEPCKARDVTAKVQELVLRSNPKFFICPSRGL